MSAIAGTHDQQHDPERISGRPIRAEFLKLGSLSLHRLVIAAAIIGAVLVAVIFCVSVPVTTGRTMIEFAPGEIITTAFFGLDFASIVMIVLAAFFVGGEYASQLSEQTFLLTPNRTKVLVAKVVVMAATSLAVGVVVVGLCLAVGSGFIAATGPRGVDDRQLSLLRLAIGGLAMPVFYGAVTALAALIFRSAALGIVAGLAILALPTLASWLPVAGALVPLLPAAALHSLSGLAEVGSAERIGMIPAIAVLLGWLTVWGVIAAVRLNRRDV